MKKKLIYIFLISFVVIFLYTPLSQAFIYISYSCGSCSSSSDCDSSCTSGENCYYDFWVCSFFGCEYWKKDSNKPSAGQCCDVECTSSGWSQTPNDAKCDDGDSTTLDICDSNCKCHHDECDSDADCDRGNDCETYTCNDPNSLDSTCSYTNEPDGTPCGEVTINCNSYCKDDATWCYYSKDKASCTKTCQNGECQSCTPDCGSSTCESCCEGSECSSDKPCSVCSGKKKCPGVKECTTYHFKCTGGACDLVTSGGCIYGILSDTCEYDPDNCKCSKDCGAECESNDDCPSGTCNLETCTCVVECSDSDNGNKPKTAGTCTDASGSYEDSCSGSILTEYYCSSGSCVSETKNCEDYESLYCANGDIYRDEWTCSGSPGYCTDIQDTLVEDCSDTCSDSDGGIYPKSKGTVTDKDLCSAGQTSCPSDIVKTDECLSSTTLREYYCSGNDYAYIDKNCEDYGSGWACVNGKCVPPDQCDSNSDCDDNNPCTNDWCENPQADNSICHNDPIDPDDSQACCEHLGHHWMGSYCCGDDGECYSSGWNVCKNNGEWCCHDEACNAGSSLCYHCPNDALDCYECVDGNWVDRCADGTVDYDSACDCHQIGESCGTGKACDSTCHCVVTDCSAYTDEASCNADPNCKWCSGDNTCKDASLVECQPPSCSTDKHSECTSSCTWQDCGSTDESCYCENGQCKACPSGYKCSNYECVEEKYTLTVETRIDVLDKPLHGVKVTVDGITKYSDGAEVTYSLRPGSHTITAEDPAGSRPFSHFWDHDANVDCNQNDPYDTDNNPYTFTMDSCQRTITVWYKVFTHFENSAGESGKIDYDGYKISGYLLREDGKPLHYSATVKLYYYDTSWHYIGSTTASSTTGYFEYSWPRVVGSRKIKAEFTPTSWYYVSSSGEYTIRFIEKLEGWVKWDGKPIKDALVEFRNESNNLYYSAKTDSNGHYSINGVVIALYKVKVSAIGYSTYSDLIEINESTSTLNFTLSCNCNNNGTCDSNEIQDCCPDCKTIIEINPRIVVQGQKVNIKVYFHDARFNTSKSTYSVKIKLMINGNEWPAELCPINNKKWREDLSCEMGKHRKKGFCRCEGNYCEGEINGKRFSLRVSQGYGYMEAECIVPYDLPAGSYKITAIPTIYSEPIYLMPAEAKIEVVGGKIVTKLINLISNTLKEFFSKVTGSFISVLI